jgi:hypothetical protein
MQCVFWEMKIRDVNRTHGFNYKIVSGFRNMHLVHSMSHYNNVLLQVRDFSCFYCHYIDGMSNVCLSIGLFVYLFICLGN